MGPLAQSAERGADNARVISSSLIWTIFLALGIIMMIIIILNHDKIHKHLFILFILVAAVVY